MSSTTTSITSVISSTTNATKSVTA
jgi:hypothetical protein